MDKDRLKKEQFKTRAKDSETMRRRRFEEMAELRKATKDDQLSRRRNLDDDGDDSSGEELVQLDPLEQQRRLERITAINNLMTGEDPEQHLKGLQMAHEFLKAARPRPIDLLVGGGMVPKLVEYLRMSEHPEIQHLATWLLTTVAYGTHDQTMAVVNAGAVDFLIPLLQSPALRTADQAVWCIGNISGDGPEIQQHLMSKGLHLTLIQMANTVSKCQNDHLSNIIWTLANLCETAVSPTEEMVNCLRVFADKLFNKSSKVVREALRGISMLSGNEEWLDEIYERNILPEIVNSLASSDWRIVRYSLKIVGGFAAGSDAHAQRVIDCVALPSVVHLMKSTRRQFMKEAARTAGNIACGTYEQILILLNAGVGPAAVHVLEQGDKDSVTEALHLLSNILTLCQIEQLVCLERQGVIPAVCKHLARRNSCAIYNALKCLHNILRVADQHEELDDYADLIEESGGLEQMEQLTAHENSTISSRASYILDKYFNDVETDSTVTEMEVQGSGDGGPAELVMQVNTDFEYNFQ